MVQAPTTKMVVLEHVQSQVQIPNWMQWKVVLWVKRGMIIQKKVVKKGDHISGAGKGGGVDEGGNVVNDMDEMTKMIRFSKTH